MKHYFRNSAFAKDHSIDADSSKVICESYPEKSVELSLHMREGVPRSEKPVTVLK